MRFLFLFPLVLPLFLFTACQVDTADRSPGQTADRSPNGVRALGGPERRATEADFESTRRDTTWRQFRTASARGQARARNGEQSGGRALGAAALDTYAETLQIPLSGDVDGDAVFYAQILLNRAGFSPGQIDGMWGQNTEKAIYWFQEREGLDASGTLDRETLERLTQEADAPDRPQGLTRTHTLTEDQAEGPFRPTPDDIYEQAEMDRLVYESLSEMLGEEFHSRPAKLRELNDGRSLDDLAAGDTVRVPDVRSGPIGGRGNIDRIVVSDGGRYLHAMSSDGRIAYHFPATLGDQYNPSPAETLQIDSITEDPWWHYQPEILTDPQGDEEAQIPPGPNNAVGLVWMNLTKEHFGIHGTSEPGTIGHTASSGCVRLTNWDALFLADLIETGITVEFRDVDGRA
ncbi:hypothetical protein BH23BAC4_BH23BAC4_14960 [soil metagenome]